MASLASESCPVMASTGQSLSTSMASTLLMAHIISSRSPTCPRGRSSCTPAMTMIGEVEAAIQQSLYTLMEGKTVVAIAHRLSTIAALDRLIVMDAGRIVEQGTHAELLAHNGIYARLWAHQSGGFLGLED